MTVPALNNIVPSKKTPSPLSLTPTWHSSWKERKTWYKIEIITFAQLEWNNVKMLFDDTHKILPWIHVLIHYDLSTIIAERKRNEHFEWLSEWSNNSQKRSQRMTKMRSCGTSQEWNEWIEYVFIGKTTFFQFYAPLFVTLHQVLSYVAPH